MQNFHQNLLILGKCVRFSASRCWTPCPPGETVLDPSHSGACDADMKSRIYTYPKKSECWRLKGRKEILSWRRWGSRWQWTCLAETENRDVAFQGSHGDLNNIVFIDTGPERILYIPNVPEKKLVSGSHWPFSVWHDYREVMAGDILNVGSEMSKIRLSQWQVAAGSDAHVVL